ncbi:STAS domain-containing protein [Patescibacteria group bacterium]|nr:STAS domain-containing protein [Patescibacteria group bacterium]
MKDILEIHILEPVDSYQVVEFVGEFDKFGLSSVKPKLESFLKTFSLDVLVLDFTGLKFINSEGIGLLFEIHTHLAKANKKLAVVGSAAHVKDVFETVGMSEVIPMYGKLADFVKSNNA